MSQGNAVVTGGAGFIGSRLVHCLIESGWRVTVIDDLSTGHAENVDRIRGDVRFIQGSITQWTGELDDAFRGASSVFHLAASVGNRRSIENPARDSQVNMLGTVKVLEATRRHGVPNFVYSSSAGIYGQFVDLPIHELHPTEPDSPYGASKLGGEKVSLSYARLYGITVVALRYFNVYGPGQGYDAYGNVIPIWGERLLRNQVLPIFGDGRQTRDFVFVDDVVAANIAAGTSETNGVFNIGSGQSTDLRSLAELMQDTSGRSVGVEFLPERLGDVRDSVADITDARHVLGYEPEVDIADGVPRYIEWLGLDVDAPARSGDSM